MGFNLKQIKKINYFLVKKILLLFIISIHFTNICKGQELPIPVNIQTALIIKILKFNTKLAEKSRLNILIVYNDNSKNYKDQFIDEFSSRAEITAAKPADIEEYIMNTDLVYFLPGTQSVSNICKTNHVLSVTGVSEYVENGLISLGIGIANNNPKIHINLTSLKDEEHNFSSDILRISKVFE